MASRKCKQSSDRFCYVCGQFIFSKKRRPIVDSLKTAYLHYFGFPVANQDKKWVPHVFCESCRIILLQWSSGEKVYLLLPDTKVTFFRNRSKVYSEFFKREGEYCYCTDIPGLYEAMNQNYDKTEWRLFIDSSKYSLKAVLLHNGNKKPSIPIGHAVNCKESYETMRTLINLMIWE
ncbi:unnamed protein product [Spodoptera exigua]|nr:unnamed protein product [Spodoptera exigua]